ncbi:MAG: hypothetical protein GY711_01515 [bacterium]|nr:hypothetical protein [bacterium]
MIIFQLPPRERRIGTVALAALSSTLLGSSAAAQGPPGYYDPVDTSSPQVLRTTLHEVIDDHARFPYTAGSTDTWDILEAAMAHPTLPGRILEVYKNEDYPAQGTGNSFYNREHSWPSSYGFPDDGSDNYPFSDCHLLFLSDSGYNSARSNKPFRFCNPGCSELPTEMNDGAGGGIGMYPGNSNWSSGAFSSGTWEVWMGRRGDIARAILYADVRYEGGTHGTTNFAEPDLVATNSQALIAGSNTGMNESVAYMGILSVLLAWHEQDPVDDKERDKNDTVFQHQGNRNPFVDHPEWVDCLYNNGCALFEVYCTPAAPNSSGGSAIIGAFGSPVATDNTLSLTADQLPTSQFGYFLASETDGFVFHPPGSSGNLCLGGQIARFVGQVQNSGNLGSFGIAVDLTSIPTSPPSSVVAGETWHFQAWFRDPPTSNFTDALRITFQ